MPHSPSHHKKSLWPHPQSLRSSNIIAIDLVATLRAHESSLFVLVSLVDSLPERIQLLLAKKSKVLFLEISDFLVSRTFLCKKEEALLFYSPSLFVRSGVWVRPVVLQQNLSKFNVCLSPEIWFVILWILWSLGFGQRHEQIWKLPRIEWINGPIYHCCFIDYSWPSA